MHGGKIGGISCEFQSQNIAVSIRMLLWYITPRLFRESVVFNDLTRGVAAYTTIHGIEK